MRASDLLGGGLLNAAGTPPPPRRRTRLILADPVMNLLIAHAHQSWMMKQPLLPPADTVIARLRKIPSTYQELWEQEYALPKPSEPEGILIGHVSEGPFKGGEVRMLPSEKKKKNKRSRK